MGGISPADVDNGDGAEKEGRERLTTPVRLHVNKRGDSRMMAHVRKSKKVGQRKNSGQMRKGRV